MVPTDNNELMSMAEPVPLNRDPGWLSAVRLVPAASIWYFRPGVPVRKAKDPLVAMRATLLVWALSLPISGAVSLWLAASIRTPTSGPALGVGFAIAGAAGSAIVAVEVEHKRRRELATAAMSAKGVAALYRQSFFLRGALSNSAALAGFVGVRLAGIVAPSVVGLVAASVGLAFTAPTTGNLRRYERTLRAGGNRLDLVSALRTKLTAPPDPSAGI